MLETTIKFTATKMKKININVEQGTCTGYITSLKEESFFNMLDVHIPEEKLDEIKEWMEDSNIMEFCVLEKIEVPTKSRGKGFGDYLLNMFVNQNDKLPIILLCDNTEIQKEGFILENWYISQSFERTPYETPTGPLLIRY